MTRATATTLALALAALAACTTVKLADGTEAKTFGSGKIEVAQTPAGKPLVKAESDGTNVLYIFEAAANAVKGVFGGAGDTVVNVEAPAPTEEPAE